jgi:5-methylcytosine-specific restriction endonuclease McrA
MNDRQKEKARESKRKFNEAHPGYQREYYQKNRDKMLEYHRKYREVNKEKRNEALRQWKKANPDKLRMYDHNRRAREYSDNSGGYTISELNTLFEQQEGFCFYCGELLYASFDREVHVEHRIPLSRGGRNLIENIVLSCSDCNLSKFTKTDDEFLEAKNE